MLDQRSAAGPQPKSSSAPPGPGRGPPHRYGGAQAARAPQTSARTSRGQEPVGLPARTYTRQSESRGPPDKERDKDAIVHRITCCRPSKSFCCGFDLRIGVGIIIALNLCVNLFYLTNVFLCVVGQLPIGMTHTASLEMQTVVGTWCFLSFCINVWALHSLCAKCEAGLRVYLLYYMFSIALDISCLAINVFSNDPCRALRRSDAVLCGMLSMVTGFTFVLYTSFQIYFAFTIWGYCSELKADQSRDGISRLLETAEDAKQRRIEDRMWSSEHGHSYGAAMGHHF